MKKLAITALSVAALALTGLSTAGPAGAREEGVRTLRGSDVAEQDQAPQEKLQLGKKPGLQKKVARTFTGQPPVIPHATANFDELTLEENQCLSCHDEANYKKKKAPKIGKNHFQTKDGKITKNFDQSRYFCTQCHAPQFDAPPLVENTFNSISVKGR